MRLYEFESKKILKQFGILIPNGSIARSTDEAVTVSRKIGKPVVLKSQILIGSRGKSGGIQFADDAFQAQKLASNLIGNTIKGKTIDTILVEEKLTIVQQYYSSIAVDRKARRYVLLVSTFGGIDIEELSLRYPERISRHWIDPFESFGKLDAEKIVGGLNISDDDAANLVSTIVSIYRVAMDYDAELVEINPLVKLPSGEFMAADAKIVIDNNAVYRHPEFEDRGLQRTEETLREAEARKQKLAYVDLDGDIGIVSNGAGLVMATLDIVNYLGGKPANFLDIGGGADVEAVRRAVMLVMSKPEVRVILINILGGITRCDLVAEGIIQGINNSKVNKPIVVRMMGTNEELGRKILRQAGVCSCVSMEEAAKQVLRL